MAWNLLKSNKPFHISTMTHGSLLFLGTGGSLGVPVIGCECAVCRSNNPRNKRTRTSALIKIDQKKFLIDCGPDFRLQALREDLKTIDGLILTHSHYDHTAGLDELRAYIMRSKAPLPCLLSPETLSDIKNRFYYFFEEDKPSYKLVTQFDLHLLEEQQGEIDFLGVKMKFISFEQVGMRVNGFRFGDLAYISDIKNFNESIYGELHGLETLVISALRSAPSLLHFSIDDAIAFTKRCGAKNAWLIHTSHEMDYERANADLPNNIRVAYDGLEIPFNIA
jgi:phosphoribosyl 1,2-cyclic phosphate phosphodiesterase